MQITFELWMVYLGFLIISLFFLILSLRLKYSIFVWVFSLSFFATFIFLILFLSEISDMSEISDDRLKKLETIKTTLDKDLLKEFLSDNKITNKEYYILMENINKKENQISYDNLLNNSGNEVKNDIIVVEQSPKTDK